LLTAFVIASVIACAPVPPEAPANGNPPGQAAVESPEAGQRVDNSSAPLTENTTAAASTLQQTAVQAITKTEADLQKLTQGNPADIDNSKYPVTPVAKLHLTGNPRQVDIAQYRLSVDGLVDHPLSLSYDEIKKYPSVTEVVLLICPDVFVDNAQWTGVPVATLLEAAAIQSKAGKITIIGLDSYRQTFTRDEIEKGDVFLAYDVDGVQLPVEHGFPLRLVVKGRYGNIWVKWIDRIEVN
jgi:DMSO/TMAO reductase YedYZ molybdopterin-dependent catalytic subunit